MVGYIAQIANRGVRYPLTLVHSVADHRGAAAVRPEAAPIDTGIEVSARTWDTVIEGMRLTNTSGTGASIFRDFPIRTAGKTGTAQEVNNRPSHSAYGGFAPLDDPQIAVYVMLPFGTTPVMSSAAARVARDVMAAFLLTETQPERSQPVNTLRR
jgi:penicillin-binding protein 2